MYRNVLAFPVTPGKSEADVLAIAEMFKADPEGYRAARHEVGISLERAYHQKTPEGEFVVAYLETTVPMSEVIAKLKTSKHSLNQRFITLAKEVHGVDLSNLDPNTLPETIISWSDTQVSDSERRTGTAFCLPVKAGQLQGAKDLAREASVTKQSDWDAMQRRLDTNVEAVSIIKTPNGPITAVYLESLDPAVSNRRFVGSQNSFDLWYKDGLSKAYPIEFDASTPMAQASWEIFDSHNLGSGSGTQGNEVWGKSGASQGAEQGVKVPVEQLAGARS